MMGVGIDNRETMVHYNISCEVSLLNEPRCQALAVSSSEFRVSSSTRNPRPETGNCFH